MEALKNGEIDCMFPANLTDYDGEISGVNLTPSLMRTDVSAVVRAADHSTFSRQDEVLVAVNEGNHNYEIFLLDHFPHWKAVYFQDTQECLKAVAEGKTDCLLISNYRYNNIARLCEKYHLLTLSTGVEMNYSFAVGRGNTMLYSILSKTTGVVPSSTVNSALSYYFTEDAKTSVWDFIKDNTAFQMLVKDADQYHTALLIAEVLEEEKILSEQGQIAAERTLRHVGELIKRSFRPVDHVCRISNSRFGIIMSRVDSGIREQVEQKIDHINETLSKGQPVVSLAVGVAFADRMNPGESILEDAE